MRLLRILMRSQLNILHLDREKLSDYLRKEFLKLLPPKIF